MDRSKHKEGKDILEAYQLAQRLQSMVGAHHPTTLLPEVDFSTDELYVLQRTRKRRVRDLWGNWCDAKELEGQTYEVC